MIEGEFLPGGRRREWCDADVLRALKRRSLAKLRREVEPVEPAALGRFLVEWQGISRPRAGLDALLTVIEQLQGARSPASVLESEILPARIAGLQAGGSRRALRRGEVVWRGIEPLGPSDGRIALYLAEQAAAARRRRPGKPRASWPRSIRALLQRRGALFFSELAAETGAFSGDLARRALGSRLGGRGHQRHARPAALAARARNTASAPPADSPRTVVPLAALGPPGSEGRWSLTPRARGVQEIPFGDAETRGVGPQLLERYGVLTREAVHAEGIAGGFSAVYEVLKALEDAGRIRRGYFVAGLGATQFALPGAEDRLRSLREPSEEPETLVLAATDPANPYGAALPWPETDARPQRAQRGGAQVILRDGALIAYAGRTERNLITFLPSEEPERGHAARAIAGTLTGLVESGRRRALLVAKVDGQAPASSPLGPYLIEAGFLPGSRGYLKRPAPAPPEPVHEEEDEHAPV